jgi:hypothetical protein
LRYPLLRNTDCDIIFQRWNGKSDYGSRLKAFLIKRLSSREMAGNESNDVSSRETNLILWKGKFLPAKFSFGSRQSSFLLGRGKSYKSVLATDLNKRLISIAYMEFIA